MKYTVYFSSVGETWVRDVDANDPDEAVDKAWDRVRVTLCHQCAVKVDFGGEWEPSTVIDEAGKVVWESSS